MARSIKTWKMVLCLPIVGYIGLSAAAIFTEPKQTLHELPGYCLRAKDTWGNTYSRDQTQHLCNSVIFFCQRSAQSLPHPPEFSIQCHPPTPGNLNWGKKWQILTCRDYKCPRWDLPSDLFRPVEP